MSTRVAGGSTGAANGHQSSHDGDRLRFDMLEQFDLRRIVEQAA